MAAKRIAQSSVNWAALAERVPENQKVLLSAFKAKSDGYLRRVLANPESAPKIDWAYYKTRVAISGMVDNFQKSYDVLKVPYPADSVTSQIEAQEKEAASAVQEYIKNSNQQIAEYKAEVEKLRALLPYDQMTMEDFRDAFPERALDPINRPTLWPHGPEDQPGSRPTEPSAH